MRQIVKRTLAVHVLGALVVWYGESRMGKTTTAQYMVREILAAYEESNPNAFRAKYYEAGEITSHYGNEMKRGIKSLYFAALGTPLDDGIYQRDPPEAIASLLVHELRRRNLQIIFIDEAGCLSLGAIWGMVLVRDVAKSLEWNLTLVFIGMDDLPQKMTRLAKLEGRVHEWCYFEEYNLKETWKLLAQLHPHFASLDFNNEEHQEQIKFLYKTYGGLPGQLVPFIQRMIYRLQEHRGEINLTFLRAVHLLTARDKQQMIQHSLANYYGMPAEKAARKSAAQVAHVRHKGSDDNGKKISPKASSKKLPPKR
ncbi:MAG: hypothetical protein ACJ74Q_11120 [Pyrinomonadaceae bacterium]